MNIKSNKNGFTLVELLVVTTIIILLSSVAVVSYQSAGKKSRDNKRKADLEQIRSALEMYRSDNNQYPAGNFSQMTTALKNAGFLTEAPSDPKGYSYYYKQTTTTSYDLCAYLESGGPANCGNNCSAPGGAVCNYKVTNP